MANEGSLWAQARADAILERWAEDPTLKLKDLVSEALDAAEAYGRDRAVLFSAEILIARNQPEAPIQAPED